MSSESRPPEENTVASLPQQIVVQHINRGGFSRLMTWLSWCGMIVFLSLFMLMVALKNSAYRDYYSTDQGISEKYHSGNKESEEKIAIITIQGVIMEGDGFVKRQIDRIREDKNRIKAVVIRVDSPGGTVTGSDYIYHHLQKLRKELEVPMVVSMGSMAASGGYYVSMAVGHEEKTIFAEPTSVTGSIGVIIPHYDISGWMEKHNIKDDSIKSHDRKQMLSITRAMPEEHRQILQAFVDESFDNFKKIVRQGRENFEKDPAKLDELATGEIFSAVRAKQVGLIDELGFIEDAIERAAVLARISVDDVRVVHYERPATLLGQFSSSARAGRANIDLPTLLELGSPRAYYLATSLPTLISSRRAD